MFSNLYEAPDSLTTINRMAYRVIRFLVILIGLAALAFIIAPIAAFADIHVKAPVWHTYVMPDNQGALSISDQPCTVPVAMEGWEQIRITGKMRYGEDIIGEVKQSRLLWHGKVYAGCYAIPGNGYVYNIDSTGDKLTPVSLELFVPHEGALPVRRGHVGV